MINFEIRINIYREQEQNFIFKKNLNKINKNKDNY